MSKGKGTAYERWAKVFNVKQLSQAIVYLKEHGGMDYSALKDKSAEITSHFNDLSAQIKDLEGRMKMNSKLQKQIVNYAKTWEIYAAYRKAGYSKEFRAEHEADIIIYQAVKKHFDSLGITKLPSVKSLRDEYSKLLEQKREVHSDYKQVRLEMKELHNVKINVEYLLDINMRRDNKRKQEKHGG